jgi:hypothetical protein
LHNPDKLVCRVISPRRRNSKSELFPQRFDLFGPFLTEEL